MASFLGRRTVTDERRPAPARKLTPPRDPRFRPPADPLTAARERAAARPEREERAARPAARPLAAREPAAPARSTSSYPANAAPAKRTTDAKLYPASESNTQSPKKKPWDSEKWLREEAARWQRNAPVVQLTEEDMLGLSTLQRQRVELSGKLVQAAEDDRATGNDSATRAIRDALGFTEDDGTVEEFGILARATGNDLKVAAPSSSAKPRTGEAARDEKIWKGLDDYFARITPEADEGQLSSLLSGTPVEDGDPLLDEFLVNIGTKANWEAGGTFDDILLDLQSTGMDPALFWQYAGEKIESARQQGLTIGDMTPDELAATLQLEKQ